jgi:hypothetical protein
VGERPRLPLGLAKVQQVHRDAPVARPQQRHQRREQFLGGGQPVQQQQQQRRRALTRAGEGRSAQAGGQAARCCAQPLCSLRRLPGLGWLVKAQVGHIANRVEAQVQHHAARVRVASPSNSRPTASGSGSCWKGPTRAILSTRSTYRPFSSATSTWCCPHCAMSLRKSGPYHQPRGHCLASLAKIQPPGLSPAPLATAQAGQFGGQSATHRRDRDTVACEREAWSDSGEWLTGAPGPCAGWAQRPCSRLGARQSLAQPLLRARRVAGVLTIPDAGSALRSLRGPLCWSQSPRLRGQSLVLQDGAHPLRCPHIRQHLTLPYSSEGGGVTQEVG